jgi:hypothetical protein
MFARFAVDGGSFQADQPRPWAPTGIRSTGAESRYDLHPDGKRLAVLSLPDQDVVQDKVVFVFNFFDYLRTIAPVKR